MRGNTPIILGLLLCICCSGGNWQLTQVIDQLEHPWSLAFIDQDHVLVTEKSGQILRINLQTKQRQNIHHNLNIVAVGQGGLLDILYENGTIWVAYTQDQGGRKTSTSVATGLLAQDHVKFKTIFQAQPPINSRYHFGARLLRHGPYLFATIGERGQGMIAQDPKSHPGSIIRLYKDGTIPEDNPKFRGKDQWLPEIYQIGVRNPQGLAFSPFDEQIYLSNHGARGGDFVGKVKYGENYGWKIIGWGGRNYIFTQIGSGKAWLPGFTTPMYTWTPSIAVSAIAIYQGEEFPEWNGHLLVTSLKNQSLRKLQINGETITTEEIIFKGNIGRIRDIKIDTQGKVYLLSNNPGGIWRLEKKTT